MNKTRKLISLLEVSHKSGLSLSSLNYYVNIGLLPIADRRGNRRLFAESKVFARLDNISKLRREGYPLRIIRRQLQGQRASS